jgi:heme exporter protein D
MEHISHLPFIVASYVVAAAVVGALLAWVIFDYRAQRRALVDLESRGLARRSASPGRARVTEQAKERA